MTGFRLLFLFCLERGDFAFLVAVVLSFSNSSSSNTTFVPEGDDGLCCFFFCDRWLGTLTKFIGEKTSHHNCTPKYDLEVYFNP